MEMNFNMRSTKLCPLSFSLSVLFITESFTYCKSNVVQTSEEIVKVRWGKYS